MFKAGVLWVFLLALTSFDYIIMASSQSVFRLAESGPKVVRGNGQFAWNMFKKMAEDPKMENIFYSPISISLALGMTYAGAKGDTREQMRATQGFSEIEDGELHSCFEDLHTHLHNTGENYTLHTANRIYMEKTYNILSTYLDTTKTHYKAETAAVDFIKGFEDARKEINAWVEGQTNQKIKDLLQPGVLDTLTRLVLVNAIYFKGNWLQKFDPQLTKPGEFHVTPKDKVPVNLMFAEKKFKYGWNRDLGAKVLELPYVGERLSMLLLLPDGHFPLDVVINKLTTDQLLDFQKTFSVMEIKTKVTLPRFKLEQSFDLGDMLSGLGMKDLFQAGAADLSGIDGTKDLYVSKVIHKAFIEVNEEGSEAAAATAVMISLMSMPQIMEFSATRPFLFFIRDNVSNSFLFFGRVTRPSPAAGKDEL